MVRKAIVIAYQVPQGVQLVEEAAAELQPGQVRIAVRAAGINPYDLTRASGAVGDDPAKLPLRLGTEVSGVVTEVGPDATGATGPVAVGDEVVAFPVSGGWAEEVAAKGASVFPKPSGAGFDEAAGLMLVGVTAWHMVEAAAVSEGDLVIVHGAAGSVGAIAVQLAALRGATVFGTASEANQGAVRELGATAVVYGDGLEQRLREVLPDGADVALDLAGTDEAVDVSLALVRDRRRIVSAVAFHRGDTGIRLVGGGPGADPGTELRNAARGPLLDLLDQGRLQVRVGAAFPLAQVADALTLVASRHPGGKVVLEP